MRPEFVRAVDPIFLTTLRFLGIIERNERLVVSDQRAMLLRKIDDAEAMLGGSEEWRLSKYALCAWIDSQLIFAPWQGNRWWADNCLEERYFGQRVAHIEFYNRATEAGALPRKDALEVYYLCVVLGFRGFYNDADAKRIADSLKLPQSVDAWCRTTAMSLQLRQGRPPIDETVVAGGSAAPLSGRSMLVSMSMMATLLIALAIGYFILFYKPPEAM